MATHETHDSWSDLSCDGLLEWWVNICCSETSVWNLNHVNLVKFWVFNSFFADFVAKRTVREKYVFQSELSECWPDNRISRVSYLMAFLPTVHPICIPSQIGHNDYQKMNLHARNISLTIGDVFVQRVLTYFSVFCPYFSCSGFVFPQLVYLQSSLILWYYENNLLC